MCQALCLALHTHCPWDVGYQAKVHDLDLALVHPAVWGGPCWQPTKQPSPRALFLPGSDQSDHLLWAQRKWPPPREGDLIIWSTSHSISIASDGYSHDQWDQEDVCRGLWGKIFPDLNMRRKVSLLSLNVAVGRRDAWSCGSHLALWGHKSEGH